MSGDLSAAGMLAHSEKRIQARTEPESARRSVWAQSRWIAGAVREGRVRALESVVAERLVAAAVAVGVSRARAERAAHSGWLVGSRGPEDDACQPASEAAPPDDPGPKAWTREDVLALLADPLVGAKLRGIVHDAVEAALVASVEGARR